MHAITAQTPIQGAGDQDEEQDSWAAGGRAAGGAGRGAAVPITLTFTGTDAFYSLDGQEAIGDFTVVLHADTSNVGPLFGEPLVPGYEGLTGTITLSGVGVGTFGSVYVYNNQFNEVVGFGTDDTSELYALFTFAQRLATYDLTTNFGAARLGLARSRPDETQSERASHWTQQRARPAQLAAILTRASDQEVRRQAARIGGGREGQRAVC